jgi:hypothetical protein
MALVLKVKATIADSGDQVYLEFREATGDYDAIDNPGGFGIPNPTRNSVAVLIKAVHKLTPGDQAATVLAYNPLTVESFTVEMSKEVNGVLNFVILAPDIFDPIGSYVDGDIVYDNQNPSAPFLKEMVASAWVPRTIDEIIGKSDVPQINAYKFPIPDACAYLVELNAQKLVLVRNVVKNLCGEEEFALFNTKFQYAEVLMRSADFAFKASAFAEAQSNIDELFTLQSIV